MHQTFDTTPTPELTPPRIAQFRKQFSGHGIDAFLIPRADEYQGEYVPPSAERLKWLTGFSGSAGIAIVAKNKAALVVDTRYTIQSRAEVDAKIFQFPKFERNTLANWVMENLPRKSIIGFDPFLHTIREIEKLSDQISEKEIKLKPIAKNLVDRVWGKERPKPPVGQVALQPLKYSGRNAEDKISDIQKVLQSENQSATVLTLPDSIAWLFNIRGSDIPHNPVALAYAIIPARGKPSLFIHLEKLSSDVKKYLKSIVRLHHPDVLKTQLTALKTHKNPVRVDDASAAWWFGRTLGLKKITRAADPCLKRKAIKNAAEIKGARAAHVRDGIAMVQFLHWLDESCATDAVDEISAAKQLETFREETGALRDISFDTISGSGPNGAIVHYRVSTATNRPLKSGELYLVDSGAQYQDGTTDITRTIAIGTPTDDMRDRFTRVLKGHIGIATAKFPSGTRGVDLDPFARRALWDVGLDYGHGTGHGIGSYLSVHEGPQSISRAGMVPLETGMICSNEPGYYQEGAYGIRIENLILVTKHKTATKTDKAFLEFETLTLAPIDLRLVKIDLLTEQERHWLNDYHANVRKALDPKLDASRRKWLKNATKEI